MKSCTAPFLPKDHDLTARIIPEAYFKCHTLTDWEFPFPSKLQERQNTEARLAWTNRYLYVHYWAPDSYIASRETRMKGPVQKDDCLSLFIAKDSQSYWVWEVNPKGTLSEALVTPKADGTIDDSCFNKDWKSFCQLKTQIHPAGWVWEIRIPFEKDFKTIPHPEDEWKIAFNRYDQDKQGRTTLSTWQSLSAEPASFHRLDIFGTLIFG